MSERICSKCSGNGPFPATGNKCKACVARTKKEWYQDNKESIQQQQKDYHERVGYSYNPDRDIAKVLRYKARHPEKYKEFYSRKRKSE